MEGWSVDGDEAQVLVSIRFLQYSHQCFSDWQKQEMKAFWSFIDSIHNQTWAQVYNTSGKSGKTGLAYTKTKLDSYPNSDFKKGLDPQITMFELRIDNVKRVHGFRHKSIFYICWLDKGHTIFP